jgi:leucyl aminopeptidase
MTKGSYIYGDLTRARVKGANTVIKLRSFDQLKKLRGLLAIPVLESDAAGSLADLPWPLEDVGRRFGFTGKKSQLRLAYLDRLPAPGAVMLAGLGPASELTAEILRKTAAKAVRQAMELDHGAVHIVVPTFDPQTIEMDAAVTVLAEGAQLANHQFTRYKAAEHASLARIDLVGTDTVVKTYRKRLSAVATVCDAVIQAREWVSTPANHKTPAEFARQVATAAERAGLEVDIKDKRWLEKKGFNALLAVNQGSTRSPRLAVLRHTSTHPAAPTVVLVGKGVTFDAGGLNLKPTGYIETMKIDMAGAAAAGATAIAAARLKIDLNLVAVLPIVENMVSGNAFRPGDIIKTYAGKTVEVGNTDAEGRLILADALAWAQDQFEPDFIVDLATLTGACKVALGDDLAGLFTEDDDLADALLRAGRHTHERCWRLPLVDEYKELLKSDVADTNNIGKGRSGGAIIAALFLSAFVERTRWAHLDIAGPAHVKKSTDYCQAGGTGYGVRLLCQFLEDLIHR